MSNIKRTITEEENVHAEWYNERPKTPDELAMFVKHLVDDFEHDYGTICHAAAASALAAVWTVDASEQGGLTGFQAGAIAWEIFARLTSREGRPLKMIDYENALYPQYSDHFKRTIPKATFKWLQEEATKRLAECDAVPDVRAHWSSIAAGVPPFGLTVDE